jgi:site-specific DNA-methyltransferase (adenine-specific)
MTWLVRLITPKGGIVLDPFAGSGSTLVAAATEGADFIGIERDPVYHGISTKRAAVALSQQNSKKAQEEAFGLMGDLPQE